MFRVHVYISGLVQGVGFRHFTQRKAEGLGLVGWVRNLPAGRQALPNGRVEAVFEGSKERVEQMIRLCHKGPFGASIDRVEVTVEETTSAFREFEIRV